MDVFKAKTGDGFTNVCSSLNSLVIYVEHVKFFHMSIETSVRQLKKKG